MSINQRGPAGAPGKQGPKGDPGIAAPKPISIALDSTDTPSSSKTFANGSTGMTVEGNCFTGSDADQFVLTGSSEYYVHGAAQYLDDGSANLAAQTVLPSGNQTIPSGSSLIAYESGASSVIEVSVPKPTVKSSGTVQLYADLVVLTGTQSFSIHLYEYLNGGRCQLSAQVIAP